MNFTGLFSFLHLGYFICSHSNTDDTSANSCTNRTTKSGTK